MSFIFLHFLNQLVDFTTLNSVCNFLNSEKQYHQIPTVDKHRQTDLG